MLTTQKWIEKAQNVTFGIDALSTNKYECIPVECTHKSSSSKAGKPNEMDLLFFFFFCSCFVFFRLVRHDFITYKIGRYNREAINGETQTEIIQDYCKIICRKRASINTRNSSSVRFFEYRRHGNCFAYKFFEMAVGNKSCTRQNCSAVPY